MIFGGAASSLEVASMISVPELRAYWALETLTTSPSAWATVVGPVPVSVAVTTMKGGTRGAFRVLAEELAGAVTRHGDQARIGAADQVQGLAEAHAGRRRRAGEAVDAGGDREGHRVHRAAVARPVHRHGGRAQVVEDPS